VVLLHGGFWRGIYTKVLMRGLAAAVVARGWAAWNVEYRRVGPMGGGGGWPATLEDVAAALGRLSTVDGVDRGRVVTCGHSAGGQLALWAAAQGVGVAGVRVSAAISLAGVVDLEEGAALGLGGGAVEGFLGGTPAQVPERYRAASPAALVPLGVPQLLVHGSADTVVPPQLSQRYQVEASAQGDVVDYVALPGAGHREVITGKGPAWTAVADFLGPMLD
jgi:acetyl esterase/lipase